MKMHSSLLALPLLAACSTAPTARPAQPVPAPSPSSTAPAQAADVQAADVAGHWTGDWGDLVLRPQPDGTVRGVYNHDEGAVVGRVAEGVFTGWWCEAPSRRPDDDAGDVSFRFGRDGDVLTLDGRWRFGATTADWREDWDLRWTQDPADAALVAAFDDASRFCPHP